MHHLSRLGWILFIGAISATVLFLILWFLPNLGTGDSTIIDMRILWIGILWGVAAGIIGAVGLMLKGKIL